LNNLIPASALTDCSSRDGRAAGTPLGATPILVFGKVLVLLLDSPIVQNARNCVLDANTRID
jgi:hypothetical protein